jgi:hypothetical protein
MQAINGTGLSTLKDESRSSLSAYHNIQPKEHIRLLMGRGRFFSWNTDWQLEIAENNNIHLFRDIAKDYGSRHTLGLKVLTIL